MKTLKLLLALGTAGGGYHYRDVHQHPQTVVTAAAGGFVSVPPIEGAKPDQVTVIAAQNCPHEDAQRADQLTQKLTELGIPVGRTNNVAATLDPEDEEANRNINAVMNGPAPMVFINGRAKSNPTLDEVVAEYKKPN